MIQPNFYSPLWFNAVYITIYFLKNLDSLYSTHPETRLGDIFRMPINVTKSYLPDFEEYVGYLKGIWERQWLTNHGPLVTELEQKLKDFLGVKHLFIVNNGTIAIQIAIKALELKGEVITTPFSYVATTSSLVWEQCTPVFADIDQDTLTISIEDIRRKITKNTKGILAVHVYGNPCHVYELEKISQEFKIPVIYDAAHAFGVTVEDRSVLTWGDISTLSFHATKVFHMAEGGAIVTENDELAHKISYLRNFGHNGPENFFGIGINGKSSEFHAAMGLCVMKDFQKIIAGRSEVVSQYNSALAPLFLHDSKHEALLRKPSCKIEFMTNFAYYPVILQSEASLLKVRAALNQDDIFPRRYFYPSLNILPYIEHQPCPSSEDISQRILCLPLYPDLKSDEIERVVRALTCALVNESDRHKKIAANDVA